MHCIEIESGMALLGSFGPVLDCGVSVLQAVSHTCRLTGPSRLKSTGPAATVSDLIAAP